VKLVAEAKKNGGFDPSTFLATIGDGRKILSVPKKQVIFAQGDAADAVFYVQEGKVRLSVVSKIGKEATIAIVSEGNFFGEGSLAGQLLRMGSAAAMTDCEILRVEKKTMMDALHREPALSEMFVAYLLARNIRYEEDLVDQLFNSSEKRLARVLLLLAHFGKEGIPQTVVTKISRNRRRSASPQFAAPCRAARLRSPYGCLPCLVRIPGTAFRGWFRNQPLMS
jgi:CRP-like cAMP-binding protein